MDAPRENLVRACRAGLASRATEARASGSEGPADGRTLYGHFTPFNVWSEIHSYFEGDFLERTVAGAFSKTIAENRANVRVLYDHGYDPQLGNKPLGPIDALREESEGPYYEVPLLDTDYNRGFLIPALSSDPPVLGASYRFNAVREEWDDDPGTSDHNPKGLPERTIKEVRLLEFGPVTFPAFPEATAKVRSLTDHYRNLDLRTSPDRAAEPAPGPGDAASSSTPDAPASAPPSGMSKGERDRALREITLRS